MSSASEFHNFEEARVSAQEALAASPLQVVESVIRTRKNGPLIAQAAQLWIKPTDVVMDVTWGRGLFWTDYQHPGTFIAHDKYTLDGVDFRQLPEEDASIDVVIYDPSYVSIGGKQTSTIQDFHGRYGTLETPRGAANLREQLIAPGIREAARVLRKGGRLFVKCMDFIESGQFQPGHHHVVQTALECGLEQVDEFIHYSGKGPQPTKNIDGTDRRQVHSRRSHTFLCVFRKKR